jgi:hypothetical protein
MSMQKQTVEHATASGTAEQVIAEQPAAATVSVMEPASAVVTTVNMAVVGPAAQPLVVATRAGAEGSAVPPVTVELPRAAVAANAPWRVAIHEAGHACMAFTLGHPIETVDIVPNHDAHRLGECVADASDYASDIKEWEENEHPQRLREKIMRSLAGRIAEELHIGTQFEFVSLEGDSDTAAAVELALTLENDEEKATALLTELEESCRRQLGTAPMFHAVRQLAAKLLDTKTLSGVEAKAVFEAAVNGFCHKDLATAEVPGTGVTAITDQDAAILGRCHRAGGDDGAS